jgi:hypothetical protein
MAAALQVVPGLFVNTFLIDALCSGRCRAARPRRRHPSPFKIQWPFSAALSLTIGGEKGP